MCSFISQHNATDVTSFERAFNWYVDCRNVHQSCCPWIECSFLYHSRLQRCFRECGSTSNRPHNRRPYVTTSTQDVHIQHLHLQDRLRPATRTAAAIIGLHNQRISAQTVRNSLREAHLHTCRPHQGLDLTAVRRRNWLEWANTHIQWCLFTDESRFSLYRADGRQRVWYHVGERFTDVNVVDRVAHGGGGGYVWAGVCYVQRTQVHFIDGILNAQWYSDEILRPIIVPFIHDNHSCCSMIMHGPCCKDLYTIPGSWKDPSFCMASILTGHVTHWAWLGCSGSAYTTACPSSCQYPATSHSHVKRSGSTFHRPQSTTCLQLYVKEMCCTAWGKWWSLQILTGFYPQYSKTATF